jgi:hypothetical protein
LRSLIGAEQVERFRVTGRWEFWVDEDGRAAGKGGDRCPRQADAIFRRVAQAP